MLCRVYILSMNQNRRHAHQPIGLRTFQFSMFCLSSADDNDNMLENFIPSDVLIVLDSWLLRLSVMLTLMMELAKPVGTQGLVHRTLGWTSTPEITFWTLLSCGIPWQSSKHFSNSSFCFMLWRVRAIGKIASTPRRCGCSVVYFLSRALVVIT